MMSLRGIFVTGTDTGVGKTLVAAALVRWLAQQGRRVVGLKPVASGARRGNGGLRNDDAVALAAESTVRLPYDLTNPYCFEPATAPHLAAADVGRTIEIPALVDWYREATAGAEVAIVEGAGGWRGMRYVIDQLEEVMQDKPGQYKKDDNDFVEGFDDEFDDPVEDKKEDTDDTEVVWE